MEVGFFLQRADHASFLGKDDNWVIAMHLSFEVDFVITVILYANFNLYTTVLYDIIQLRFNSYSIQIHFRFTSDSSKTPVGGMYNRHNFSPSGYAITSPEAPRSRNQTQRSEGHC
ncbi:hypothetical protein ACN38_g2648 [Penicillium nordicum]|uniref:Uncharacterized protein n=1 Tax=Penicillium nordicum TaxID=229535 RepID=A0A0M9WIS7_9EURO|nr:hypothetical protein ACN38_g2648 [Penicillium nordicum]